MPLPEGPVGVEDLVLLEPLDEESLIKNLQLRYENKEIYVSSLRVPGGVPRGFRHPYCQAHLPQPPPPQPQTYIGNVVVSVNPYQQLPIYGPELIAKYRDYNFYELKPHM